MAQLLTPKDTYTFDYPQAIELCQKQLDLFWLPDEVQVEKDVQDILVNMTPAEKHGVITTLKLFTIYELLIGKEYWGWAISEMFPRPDIQKMCNMFSFFEINVHAPFYNNLNKALNLDTDEFYSSYLDDPVLSERIGMIESYISLDKPFETLVALSVLEGLVLYSNFAFLKHFQSKGKNKLLNVVRGINLSLRDENLHFEASSWLARQLCAEMGYPENRETIAKHIVSVARDHEHAIIDKIFEFGEIEGITSQDMKMFVDSRANLVLLKLEVSPLYLIGDNPIGEWFYKAIEGYQANDFFTGIGSSYVRSWVAADFVWE